MRRVLFRVGAVLLAGILLVSCAQKPIPFDKTSAGEIKRIGLITPLVPPRARVYLASSVGGAFGLIGGLVEATMQENREKTFLALMGKEQFSASEALNHALVAELQARGYEVVPVSAPRDKDNFIQKPPAVDPPVDAYLDVVVDFYGYTASGISSSNPYRPFAGFQTRLLRAKDNSVLMKDQIVYNAFTRIGDDAVSVPPDTHYEFVDFDTLVADPKKAVEGVQVAFAQSSSALAKLLR
jgi:hypothetical protein